MKTTLARCALFIGVGLLLSGCAWGVVTDANTGDPVEGARVIYVDSEGDINAQRTGPGGLYRFDAVEGDAIPAKGSTMFIVLAPGYQVLVTERNVSYDDNDAGTWEIQSFELRRVGAPSPTPTPSVTRTPTVTPSSTPTSTRTPTPTATGSPMPTATPTPTVGGSPTLTPTATSTP